MYHNTTDSVGAERLRFANKAKTQDEKVLTYFQWHCATNTASELRRGMIKLGWITGKTPLTSIRRALTNLTTSGKLAKTTNQYKGPLGRPEYAYTLPAGQLELVV